MLSEIPFGEFLPDLVPSHSNHLVVAENVYPIANGYGPVRALEAFTSPLSYLGGAGRPFIGGGSFVDSTGISHLVGAYYQIDGTFYLDKWADGAWENVFIETGWGDRPRARIAQFGDNLLLVNGSTVEGWNLVSDANVNPTDSPDLCMDIARVRDFVMVLTEDGNAQWCQFNNSEVWTTGTNQADYQPLLGGGSPVAIVGGEYGIILQKQAIKRVTYVGAVNDIIFQFDEISPEIGCMAQGTVCNVGRLIFFLSERGFQMCDGESVTPISDEKITKWFFANHSRSDIDTMWSAIDPRAHQVMWSVPGNPGTILVYNWVLKRWTVLKIAHQAVFTGFSAPISLEGLDAIYTEGLDLMETSLDNPSFNGGNPVLLVVDNLNQVGALTGDYLQARIRQNNIELSPGKRTRLRGIRPVTDASDVSVSVNSKVLAGAAENLIDASSMRSNGKMPIRANGRYFDNVLTIAEGAEWSYAQGCEYEFEHGDGR